MWHLRTSISIIAICICSELAMSQEDVSRILINNVNVFDGTSDQLAMGKDVLIEGNLIKEIGRNLVAADDRSGKQFNADYEGRRHLQE